MSRSAVSPDPILAFLGEIGLGVVETELEPEEGFLPGIRVHEGALHVDRDRLAWPGDLLHEAGHLALAPPGVRARMSDTVEVPGASMWKLEEGAKPWSYAAALHIGIDPAVVFHEGGYRGYSPRILQTFALGVYPGVAVLVDAGLTAPGVFPRMLRWLAA